MSTIFEDSVTFRGEVDLENATDVTLPSGSVVNATVASNAAITRAKLAQETKTYDLPWENWRVWNAYNTVLPGTSADDDLALIAGTFGTNTPMIKSRDLKTLSTSLYARTTYTLPAEYDAAQAFTIRVKGGMETTVAGTSCVVDIECYKSNGEGGLGSDLCATAAQSINSLTLANKDFTITPTGLAAGDKFDIRLTVTVVDGATGTTVTAAIGAVQALVTVKG